MGKHFIGQVVCWQDENPPLATLAEGGWLVKKSPRRHTDDA
jgi:hypothetical protein